jgi:CHASE2 domain-containing sensor protein
MMSDVPFRTHEREAVPRPVAILMGFGPWFWEKAGRFLARLVILIFNLAPKVIVVLLVAVVNPFQVKTASEQTSSDVFQRIASAVYPGVAQSKIAIVLINDKSLKSLGQIFLPRFTLFSRIVDELDDHDARSVFFDVNFSEERGDKGDIDQLVGRMSNLPVMLASTAEQVTMLDCADIQSRNLEKLANAAWYEPHAMMRNGGRDIVLLEPDPCDPDHPRMAVPLALYAQYVASGDEGERECADAGTRDPRSCFLFHRDRLTKSITLDLPDPKDNATQAIEWGNSFPRGAEAINPEYRGYQWGCEQGGWGDLWLAFWDAALTFGAEPARSNDSPRCFHHPVIRAEWLLEPKKSGTDEKALREQLDGRIVLVGVAYGGQNIVVPSPVFGDIPSVLAQAMALDNLIARDGQYLRGWDQTFVGNLGGNDLIEFGLVVLFALIGHVVARAIAARGVMAGLRLGMVLWTAGAALALGVVVMNVFVLHREPVNWIGVVLTGAMLSVSCLDATARGWRRRLLRTHRNLKRKRVIA